MKNPRFAIRLRLTHPTITRNQILFTTILSFLASALFFIFKNPFSIGFPITILTSACFHALIYLNFAKFEKLKARTFTFISIFNLILMGGIIHFTGGILSPFVFVFFSILLSDASHGIEYPGLIAALIIYMGVIGLEYTGILPPLQISPSDIYAHGLTLAAISMATMLFMVVTGQTYMIIMSNLRTHLEHELAEKQVIIKQLVRMEAPSQIGLLVNKIVHDLRGPLGAIGGFISILTTENNLNPESIKDCEVMTKELKRIQKMINRMLLYSRPTKSEKESQCPVELVETVLTVFSFYPGAKNVEFVRDFPPPQTLNINANKEGLQQVYFNLFKNAIEAIPLEKSRPKIVIKIHTQDGAVLIEVEDNGPGTPADIIQSLGKEITSTKKEGGGLGLIISREIVESNGGQFKIFSTPGAGTRVVTTFPV